MVEKHYIYYLTYFFTSELYSVDEMEALSQHLSGIESKVRQLALKLERIQKENSALKAQNEKLVTDLAAKNNQVLELKDKVAKSVQPIVVEKKEQPSISSKKLKKEIDQYIKEVDKCIEWLQNS